MKSIPPALVQLRAGCFVQTLDGLRIACVYFEQKAVQKCQGASFHAIAIVQSDKGEFQDLCGDFQSVPEVFRHNEASHSLELYWKTVTDISNLDVNSSTASVSHDLVEEWVVSGAFCTCSTQPLPGLQWFTECL